MINAIIILGLLMILDAMLVIGCITLEEKERSCRTCKHRIEPPYSEACDGCTRAHSNWERKRR